MIGLARSSYYAEGTASRNMKFSERDLRDFIERTHVELPAYGYRRIYHELLRKGIRVNAKRIRRVMNRHSLKPIVYRTFKVATTDSKHEHRVHPNLVKGKTTTALNEVWVTDITYIRLRREFIYLAALLDRHSRKIIGWAISKSLHSDLCLAALEDAIEKRKPPPGCIHHSDRGVQYACDKYVAMLKNNGFKISMSAKGNPYDNAHMESFFKSLKYDEVHLHNYENFEDALKRLPHYIDTIYNQRRLHSSLGYCPPEEFENHEKRRQRSESQIDNIVLIDRRPLNQAALAGS